MKEKRDCKIVQDLLPNYIENLTNEKTNQYIEEHFKECEDCKQILENMKKDIPVNKADRDNREVKYIKKFRKKMTVLKLIILIIVIIFIALTLRKVFIISDLSNRAENIRNSKNWRSTTYSYDIGEYTTIELSQLDDQYKVKTTKITEEGKETTMMFAKKSEDENSERYRVNTYTETEEEKTARLNMDMGVSLSLQNWLYTDNWLQLVIHSIFATVKNATYNGEECYYITNFETVYSSSFVRGMYVDKETGLPISTIAYEYQDSEGRKGRYPAAEYVYEFDCVTEEDFIEPDQNEYTILKE